MCQQCWPINWFYMVYGCHSYLQSLQLLLFLFYCPGALKGRNKPRQVSYFSGALIKKLKVIYCVHGALSLWENEPDHRPFARFANCVTHMPWCKSGSLTRGGGENVPGIPGACITRKFTYLVIGPWKRHQRSARLSTSFERHDATNILFIYSKLMIAVYDISNLRSWYFRPLWMIKISESFPMLLMETIKLL